METTELNFPEEFSNTLYESLIRAWQEVPYKDEYRHYYTKSYDIYSPQAHKNDLVQALRMCGQTLLDSARTARSSRDSTFSGTFEIPVYFVGAGFTNHKVTGATYANIYGLLQTNIGNKNLKFSSWVQINSYQFMDWFQSKNQVIQFHSANLSQTPFRCASFVSLPEKCPGIVGPQQHQMGVLSEVPFALPLWFRGEIPKYTGFPVGSLGTKLAIKNNIIISKKGAEFIWWTPVGPVREMRPGMTGNNAWDELYPRIWTNEGFVRTFFGIHHNNMDFSDAGLIRKITRRILAEKNKPGIEKE